MCSSDLQYPSRFDKREQIWIWEYKAEEDGDVHEMYMDKGETIRFRVTSEQFFDTTPSPFPVAGAPAPTPATAATIPTSSAQVGSGGLPSGPARSQSPITASGIAPSTGGAKEEPEPISKAPYSLLVRTIYERLSLSTSPATAKFKLYFVAGHNQ